MPIPAQRLDNNLIQDQPLTTPTLSTSPLSMTPHTPREPFPLHKWRVRSKRIPTLRAEEMPRVPFRPAGNDDLALDRRAAGLTARREELVEIEMAVEPQTRMPVFSL